MPLSRSRDYLSIGEVLDSVRSDFPDVSISKIRFLEAECLIAPERTPAGYRKFFEPDVARLRYILSLQRDHFLPLRVIKERLAEADETGSYPEAGAAPASSGGNGHARSSSPPAPEPALVEVSVQMSRTELRDAAGLTDAQMAALEDFGVIGKRDSDAYDANDLVIARTSGRFFAYGVEPRHLRMYRQFADREAAFFEQIVTPALMRKDPDGADEAHRSVKELLALSRQMREAALRSSLGRLG
ncbi:MAG TPA: MerR family transcriptional regulator [Actinomycetota bacterium]|nr:MerR family transcriptional regulator [Actinomycetota bacterium]